MKILLTIGFVFIGGVTYAQHQEAIDRILETIALDEFSEDETRELTESLMRVFHNPLDLNTSDHGDLASLYVLTEMQINSLLKYISSNGPLYSIYELQAVEGFDSLTIKQIQPFIIVHQNSSILNSNSKWNGYFLNRFDQLLEEKNGFRTGDSAKIFLGSPQRIISKLRLAKGPVQIGLTFEKDAGEKIFWSHTQNNYGFDHIGGFIAFNGEGLIKRIIIGDYSTLWGQGLVLGNGFQMGKSVDPIIPVKRNSTGPGPYASISESHFSRGAAIILNPGRFTISSIYSNRKIDASLNEKKHIRSFRDTGLHRNYNELDSRFNVGEQTIGWNINYSNGSNDFIIGQSLLYYQFNTPLSEGNNPYQVFNSTKSEAIVSGLHMELRKSNMVGFGEFATASSGGMAGSIGVMASLSHRIEFALHIRNFGRRFNNPYALQPFRESTNLGNEKGIYWGLKFKPIDKVILSGFADFFTLPWLSYSATSPTSGTDLRINCEYVDSKILQLRASIRMKSVDKNYALPAKKIPVLAKVRRLHLAFDSKIHFNQYLSYKVGLRYSISEKPMETSNGFLAYSDLDFHFTKTTIKARYAIVDSPEFANRFYIYEPDLLYTFSVPLYYGKGIKYFIVIRQRLTRNIKVGLKWSRMTFRDREQIGSGVDLIQSNKRTELKGQLVLKF